MSGPRVVVVGDAVVDVDITGEVDRVGPEGCLVLDATSERRRPGAAALAATFAAGDGAAATLVTAIGADEPGRFIRRHLEELGVEVVAIALDGLTPQKWRLRSPDGTLLRVDRDCREVGTIEFDHRRPAPIPGDVDAILVADYGRGLAKALSAQLARAAGTCPVIWDPHPKGPVPPQGLDLLTPNEREARGLDRATTARVPRPSVEPRHLAERLANHFAAAVCITQGAGGVALAEPGQRHVEIPARPVTGDACGAGDRFASAVTVQRATGAEVQDAVTAGVEAAANYVATGHGTAPATTDAFELAASVAARGGRVVATGGCFDLLHAGHVRLLEAARALGDCLIVCLNGDDSIRRLKGPGRPVVGLEDRRRVIEALACVDAVAVFHEDTPIRLLERLRPHVFVKGADYAADELPERAALSRWGGRVAIVPLFDGRSTSRLIERARAEAV